MKEYKLCEIDFKVGDIVEWKQSESHQPFRVLKITPRVVDDSEIGRLLKLAYNVKDGDAINPTVDLEILNIGEPIELEQGLDGWDADYLTKIDLEYVKYLIKNKEEDVQEDMEILLRYKKVKELIEHK